jgi:hypothetical protein
VPNSEIRKSVVIDYVKACEPLKGRLILTSTRDLACRTDSTAVRVQPETHEQMRIECRPSSLPLHGPDRGKKTGEVKSTDELPDRASGMIVIDQPFNVHSMPTHLTTIYAT